MCKHVCMRCRLAVGGANTDRVTILSENHATNAKCFKLFNIILSN